MSESFEKVIPPPVLTAYADFEKKVRNIIAPISGPLCAACKSICCKYDFCIETLQSPFLYLVAEQEGCLPKSSVAAPQAGPFALGPHGCTILAGRSKLCSAFNCSQILRQFRSDHEVYAFKCISDMLHFLTAHFSGKTALDDIKDARLFTETRFEKFLRKIDLARELLAASLWLMRNGDKTERVEAAARRVPLLATYFPFTGLPKGRGEDFYAGAKEPFL